MNSSRPFVYSTSQLLCVLCSIYTTCNPVQAAQLLVCRDRSLSGHAMYVSGYFYTCKSKLDWHAGANSMAEWLKHHMYVCCRDAVFVPGE
jgi:hypothetical protein